MNNLVHLFAVKLCRGLTERLKNNKKRPDWPYKRVYNYQCDQIRWFIALWATFQSLWQQLICPNCPHFRGFLYRCQNISFFLVKSFLGNFDDRHLATFYWSHTDQSLPVSVNQGELGGQMTGSGWDHDFPWRVDHGRVQGAQRGGRDEERNQPKEYWK